MNFTKPSDLINFLDKLKDLNIKDFKFKNDNMDIDITFDVENIKNYDINKNKDFKFSEQDVFDDYEAIINPDKYIRQIEGAIIEKDKI